MLQPSNVVPETTSVTEDEFRAAMLAGLARCEKKSSDKALAYVMDITTKQLGNIKNKGGTPSPKRLWDAHAAHGTGLEDIAALYGMRLVAKEAVCDVDDVSVMIARLLLWLHEAQHPNSPGGRKVVHSELLPAEFMIRQLNQATGDWLATIADHRKLA
jgi:hypothetical protein